MTTNMFSQLQLQNLTPNEMHGRCMRSLYDTICELRRELRCGKMTISGFYFAIEKIEDTLRGVPYNILEVKESNLEKDMDSSIERMLIEVQQEIELLSNCVEKFLGWQKTVRSMRDNLKGEKKD